MRLRILFFIIALCAALSACSRDHATSPLSTPTANARALTPDGEVEAVSALAHMIGYLRTQRAFEVISDTITDGPAADGGRLRLSGRTIYRVRNADGFFVEVRSESGWRQFFYDRRFLTIYAPNAGYYAQIATPANMSGALEVAAHNYGIELPLADFLSWSVAGHAFTRATNMGFASVGHTDTTQYKFREGDLEWRIWIETGERPLPRQITITNLAEAARPSYTALLTWTLDPQFSDDDLAFRPPVASRQIPINLVVADSARSDWNGGWIDTFARNNDLVVPVSMHTRSVAHFLPASCEAAGSLGTTYYNCDGVWYEPRFAGTSITYVVVTPPRRR